MRRAGEKQLLVIVARRKSNLCRVMALSVCRYTTVYGGDGEADVKPVVGMIPQLDQELQEVRIEFASPPVNKEERASTLARYGISSDFLSYTWTY